MDVKQAVGGSELKKLIDYVTGGEYTFGPDIVDAEGRPISSLRPFEAYSEVEEGDWPQSSDGDGVDYIGMVALQENADKVYEVVEDHGEDVVRMAAELIDKHGVDPVHISVLSEFIRINFKGRYDSPGAFAREFARDYERAGFDQKTIDEFNEWIDWESYANSPNMSDHTFLKPEGLGEDQAGPVYVFDADPEVPQS